MFIEPGGHITGNNRSIGWVEVVCGSMFSGKTEELIRRLRRALMAQQKVEIFKPIIDQRYGKEKIVSHDERALHSQIVNSSQEVLLNAAEADVVGIDEVQFFDDGIIKVVKNLADSGKRVIVAGLDMDFKGRPFHPMDKLMATAEYITKVHAICMNCGNVALHSYRRSKSEKKIVIGEKDIYEALCRKCFNERMEN